MKILIISDSHAMDRNTLLSFIKDIDCDVTIHCGDIYMTYEGLPLSSFHVVKGNNDFGNLPKEITITLDQQRFFITHGHLYDVNYSLESLFTKAKQQQADIICYGHTHQPDYQIIDGITVINPGSLLFPRGRYRQPTYCIYDTEIKKIFYYNFKTRKSCNPFTETSSFSFKNLFKR